MERVVWPARVVEETRAAVVLLGQRAPERGVQEREQLARVVRVLRAQWNERTRTRTSMSIHCAFKLRWAINDYLI